MSLHVSMPFHMFSSLISQEETKVTNVDVRQNDILQEFPNIIYIVNTAEIQSKGTYKNHKNSKPALHGNNGVSGTVVNYKPSEGYQQ